MSSTSGSRFCVLTNKYALLPLYITGLGGENTFARKVASSELKQPCFVAGVNSGIVPGITFRFSPDHVEFNKFCCASLNRNRVEDGARKRCNGFIIVKNEIYKH